MKKIAFVLFHTGETRALKQTMLDLAAQTEDYRVAIIPVGQAARSSLAQEEKLSALVKLPQFITEGQGSNQEYERVFPEEAIQEVVQLCQAYDNVVLGFPAKIQEQVAAALPADKRCLIYFDVGCDAAKLRSFAPFAKVIIFTSLLNQTLALSELEKLALENPPKVIAARHGDFDLWVELYKRTGSEELELLRQKLSIRPKDKMIVWAGGYGKNLSAEDEEAKAFRIFTANFKAYFQDYKLRITLHPGLKSLGLPKDQLLLLQDTYYLGPLKEAGLAEKERALVMAPIELETRQLAFLALGVFSMGSTVAPQAVSVGARAKNILPLGVKAALPGIKDVSATANMLLVLERWKRKERRQEGSPAYQKALRKLSIPAASSRQMIEGNTVKEANWLRFGVKALMVGLGLFVSYKVCEKKGGTLSGVVSKLKGFGC